LKPLFTIFKVELPTNFHGKNDLLTERRIALWDTLKYCEREGCAGELINNGIAKNFSAFQHSFPRIGYFIFNGTSAYRFFNIIQIVKTFKIYNFTVKQSGKCKIFI
jgi:G:T/U-mismatch repair DNA glycosylase